MYKIVKEKTKNKEGKEIEIYGITNDSLTVSGVTEEKEKLIELCRLCNKLELSPLHLRDVIEDFKSQL